MMILHWYRYDFLFFFLPNYNFEIEFRDDVNDVLYAFEVKYNAKFFKHLYEGHQFKAISITFLSGWKAVQLIKCCT